MIWNFVLDNIVNYLLKNLPSNYLFDNKEINRIRNCFGDSYVKEFKKLVSWPVIWIWVYRSSNEILILGQASQKQFLQMHNHLILFFKKCGLINNKKKENSVKVFMPGAYFDFLEFQFQCANSKNWRIYKKKYSLNQFCNRFIIIIRSKTYKYISISFKTLFKGNKVNFPVAILIKSYNKWLIGVVKYFGLIKDTWIQLLKLNHFAYLKFKRFIIWKFSSKPKLKTFIREKYFTSDYLVKDCSFIQLKVQDILFYEKPSFSSISPINHCFKTYIYLENLLYIENVFQNSLSWKFNFKKFCTKFLRAVILKSEFIQF